MAHRPMPVLFACGLAVTFAACTSLRQGGTGPGGEPSPIPPEARVEIVTDTFHGVEVADPYRWLEDWEEDKVRAWSEGQNAFARAQLHAIPGRESLHARITEIVKSRPSASYGGLRRAGEHLLAVEFHPDQQQPTLVRLSPAADRAPRVVLVDPNALDPSGGTTIDWFEPSNQGRLVAVSMSEGGSEEGDVSIFRVADGERVDVVVPRVNAGTAGGDVAWLPDDSGFYYTRYPAEGDRPEEDRLFYQQVYLHRLGTPVSEDRYVLGEGFPRIAETTLMMHPETGHLIAWVQDGDSNRFAIHLLAPGGEWQRISDFGDGHLQPAFGPDGRLYVLSRAGEPRGHVLRTSVKSPDLGAAEVVVPPGDGVLSHSFYSPSSPSILVTGNRLYLVVQVGGPSELRVFDLDGEPLPGPDQLPVSTIFGLAADGEGGVYFGNSSYVSPTRWVRFDPARHHSTVLDISSETTVDTSDVEVAREMATSEDGTQVPVNILMPKGMTRDGTRAVLVTGYGGYGISMTPYFSSSRHVLFEHGMVFAQANLRGGGEFGEQWHEQGRLTRKQNVFDDFIAVVEHLVERGYAAPDRVAIIGGSNGGLLMGAVLTQRPELFAAVVSSVGIYDSVRVELDPNGAFNVPEFGTVDDPEQFAALYAYSPYHNVADGQDYPPILLTTGANDPRVNPMHSRKFAARLLAAQDGEGTVLLRTSSDTGHGGGTPLDEVIELLTDEYAFIFHHVGIQGY